MARIVISEYPHHITQREIIDKGYSLALLNEENILKIENKYTYVLG